MMDAGRLTWQGCWMLVGAFLTVRALESSITPGLAVMQLSWQRRTFPTDGAWTQLRCGSG